VLLWQLQMLQDGYSSFYTNFFNFSALKKRIQNFEKSVEILASPSPVPALRTAAALE
jgi:hypothetical protein